MPLHEIDSPQTLLGTISEITPYMYLSGYGCITEQKLKQIGITCVIDATNMPRARGREHVEYVKVRWGGT
jgi:hypothetical protein